jgi:hypothetical protein
MQASSEEQEKKKNMERPRLLLTPALKWHRTVRLSGFSPAGLLALAGSEGHLSPV